MYISRLIMVIILFLTFSSCGGGDKTVTAEKLFYISAMESSGTVSLYIGDSDEDFIDVTVAAMSLKQGNSLRSVDAGLKDGLTSSASWNGVNYFSSSKHKTFTDLQIESINLADKTATIRFEARLVALKPEKYIDFKSNSYQISGKLFDEFMELTL